MTALFIKELITRGGLQRCLIICPSNPLEQWQDELDRRFHLPFEIMVDDALEAARSDKRCKDFGRFGRLPLPKPESAVVKPSRRDGQNRKLANLDSLEVLIRRNPQALPFPN